MAGRRRGMTSLRQTLEEYLRIRRRLGFQLNATEQHLEKFVGFMERAGAERITSELAVMWARLPQDAHPHQWSQRLTIVRCFARYVATLDPETEIPSTELLRARRARVAPYIYSPTEITALIEAAGQLTGPLRAASYQTVIGLMATTGLRLGEALGLDRQDVDLKDGALHVRARQHKQREVRYTRPRPRRCAATPASATVAGRSCSPKRSSSTPEEPGSPSRSSTTTSRR
jgi:integrase/recombinase XerD